MIQAAWYTIKKYLGETRSDTTYDSDLPNIRLLHEYMIKFVRPDGLINIDLYKKDSAFFLTFYFSSNLNFKLTLPDYSYSTHIYDGLRVNKSGLNPIQSWNYDLTIDSEKKFLCNQKGQTQLNKLIKKMYSNSLLPTVRELDGRYEIKCINGEYLAVSNFKITSTTKLIEYIKKRIGSNKNIIFLANCSSLDNSILDDSEETRKMVRSNSLSLRSEDVEELSPDIKNFPTPEEITFNKSNDTNKSKPNQTSPRPQAKTELSEISELNVEVESEIQSQAQDKTVQLQSKIEYYNTHTSKIFNDKINEAKRKSNNNIFVAIKSLFIEYENPYDEDPKLQKTENKFFILSTKACDLITMNIIKAGLNHLIKYGIEVVPEQIISFGLYNFFLPHNPFAILFNKLDKQGYANSIDFYNHYMCKLYPNYKIQLVEQFIESIGPIEELKRICENPPYSEFKTQEFIRRIKPIVELKVRPTEINYNISTKFTLDDLNRWTNNKMKGSYLNFWFIKIGREAEDYLLEVIGTTEAKVSGTTEAKVSGTTEAKASDTKSKYLKYKKKYLNLKSNL